MYCGRQSHARTKDPIRRHEHEQILPFERTQISDKSRTNRHSRNGLYCEYIKAPGMSNVPIRHPLLETLVLSSRRNDRRWHGENRFSIASEGEYVAPARPRKNEESAGTDLR